MEKTYETKKHSTNKIVFLGIFITVLLIARFIVALRSVVVLSEPIKLHYSGLSVSIPAGNGWQSEKQWKYQENGFSLISFFTPGPGSPTALAYCRYLLAATEILQDMQFEQKASELDGAIVKTGQIRTETLIIDWAHIKKQGTLSDTFFGIVLLPNNRQLDIEVHQTTGDTDMAEQLFKHITESLKFEGNQLLELGSEIVAEIKNAGLDSFVDNQNQQFFFLIKNEAKHTIGFTMDVFVDSGWKNQLNIQVASSFYTRGRPAQEQVTFLQSNNSLDALACKSETHGPLGSSGTEITMDKTGTMTIRKFGRDTEEKSYRLGPSAIPEVFFNFVLRQMLKGGYEKIIADIIETDGKIIPTLISTIETEQDAGYAFRLDFLNNRGYSGQVYLNDQKQIYKVLLQQESLYTLERTGIEDIIRQFPERADYILQRSKMSEQDQL